MEMMAILKNFENSGKLKVMAPEGQTCIFFILISTLERLLQFSYANLASMHLGPKPVIQDTDERTPQKT